MRNAAAIVALLAASAAHAEPVVISWTEPTLRTDGTPLPAAEIAGYRLVWTFKGNAQPDLTLAPGVTYTLETGPGAGLVCVTLRTVDTDGLESDPTGEVCRKARPGKPVNVATK